jgi:hypothetical protein
MAKPPKNPALLDGRAYLYSIQRNKERVFRLELGISLRDTARFTLRREGTLDRFAKWLGLTREWQTNDLDFDGRVFIQSEDSRLHDALSLDRGLRVGIRTLLTISTVFRLEMSNGVLWVSSSYDGVSHGRGTDAEIAGQFAKRVLSHLIRIGASLAEVSAPWENSRDPGLQRYRILLGAGTVLGIAGMVSLFARPGPDFPHALQRSHIYTHATCATAIAFVLMLVMVLAWMGRASRTHRVLACMLFVTTPGVWCAASVYYEHRNNAGKMQSVEFKTKVSAVHVREGVGRRRRRLLRRSYWVYFTAMPDARIARSLKVDRQTYQSLSWNRCVFLDVHVGTLGDPWIAGIRPVGCD